MFDQDKKPVPAEWRELYKAANQIAAHIGAYGEIDAKHCNVFDLMEALRGIDGGSYDHDIANGVVR